MVRQPFKTRLTNRTGVFYEAQEGKTEETAWLYALVRFDDRTYGEGEYTHVHAKCQVDPLPYTSKSF